MKDKTLISVFVFILVSISILGVVLSFPFNVGGRGGEQNFNVSSDEIANMKNFTDSLNLAIQNDDFATWKSLIESQLTQDNFNRIVEENRMFNKSSENMTQGSINNQTPPQTGGSEMRNENSANQSPMNEPGVNNGNNQDQNGQNGNSQKPWWHVFMFWSKN